jgi:hypothetical protein
MASRTTDGIVATIGSASDVFKNLRLSILVLLNFLEGSDPNSRARLATRWTDSGMASVGSGGTYR